MIVRSDAASGSADGPVRPDLVMKAAAPGTTGARRRSRDRGEVTVTTLMMPLIVIALMFVVQVGLAYHARQVVAGATQDGAAAAAMSGGSPEGGAATANGLIEQSAGNLLEGLSVSGSRSGEVVTVRAKATVIRVFPLFPTFTVSASSSSSTEEFRPQGSP